MRTNIALIVLLASNAMLVHGEEDCRGKYPRDIYAQCVCGCQNAFEKEIKKCPTEPCIGAAALARTACVAKCSKFMDMGTDVSLEKIELIMNANIE